MKSREQIAIEALTEIALGSASPKTIAHKTLDKIATISPPAQGSIDADGLPPLPEPDTTNYAPFGGAKLKFHSTDQIYAFASARVLADRAARQSAAPVEPVAKVMQAIMDAPKNIAARATLTPKGNMAPSEPVPQGVPEVAAAFSCSKARPHSYFGTCEKFCGDTAKCFESKPERIGAFSSAMPTEPGYTWHWTGEASDTPVLRLIELSGGPTGDGKRRTIFGIGGYVCGFPAKADCEAVGGYWAAAVAPTATTATSGGEAVAFGYFYVDSLDIPYPGSGFSRTKPKDGLYETVTPLYLAPPPLPATDAASVAEAELSAILAQYPPESWAVRNRAFEEAAKVCDQENADYPGAAPRRLASAIRALVSKEAT